MGFNSAFKGLNRSSTYLAIVDVVLLSQNTTILCHYLYLSLRHVSALALGQLQVTRYITEETIQCES